MAPFLRGPLGLALLALVLPAQAQTAPPPDAELAGLALGYFYERDVREAIARVQASLEPALTVILGLLLLAVMSAVMLPIYDIITKMKI